jgi:hypothetical protein
LAGLQSSFSRTLSQAAPYPSKVEPNSTGRYETTDTDATEFMPAKHAKVGVPYEKEVIPDGFYVVGDSVEPQLGFLQTVNGSVRKVTHIAPSDDEGKLSMKNQPSRRASF